MNKLFGKLFALLIPLLLMLMITVVVSRYFFEVGRTDLQELALYVHSLIFLGCAGWAYLEDEHVRVDIIYRNASNNYKRKIDTLGIIFFLIPLVILIGYFSINFVSTPKASKYLIKIESPWMLFL